MSLQVPSEMLVDTLVGTSHASVAQGPEQTLEPGSAFLGVAGSGSRTPLPHPATLQASSRVAVFLEHCLGDIHSPRRMLCARPRRRHWAFLRDVRDD
eukprot:7124946-Alexandrium_andersonii.AAC.1